MPVRRLAAPLLALAVVGLAAGCKGGGSSGGNGGEATSGASGASIQGEIDVAPQLASKVGPSAVVYVFARPAGETKGPPTAVKRIPVGKFPMAYSLTAQDVMLQGAPFAGKMTVSVRIANDGDAMPHAGDLEGSRKDPVAVGEADADVTADKVD